MCITGDGVGVPVHGRLLARPVGDPQDPHFVILQLNRVVVGIGLRGILREGWPREHEQQGNQD
jgi:hypothetical protein